MPRYGVVVREPYEEAWMHEYDTLKEARAEVRMYERQAPYGGITGVGPKRVTLVRIMSEHEEGSNPQYLTREEKKQISFNAWSKGMPS